MLALTEATDKLRTLAFEFAAAARRLDLLAEASTQDPAHLPDARVAYAVLQECISGLAKEAPEIAASIREGLNLQPEGEHEAPVTEDGLVVGYQDHLQDLEDDERPHHTSDGELGDEQGYLARVRLAHSQRQADQVAADTLAAFAAGRSAEIDPERRGTLTEGALAAGWGGGR